jgi:hypothetical protein
MVDERDQRGCRERGRHGHGCARDRPRREPDRVTAKASILFYAGRGRERSRWPAMRMSEELTMRECSGGTDQIPRAGRVDVPFRCKLYSGLVGSLTPALRELIDALA